MSEHSVPDAERCLAGLIDRVLAGEDVVITRDGHPVVALMPIRTRGRPLTDVDLDWLAARRTSDGTVVEDAGQALSRLRDAEW